MTRRRGRFATIPPPPQEGLSERELAFYTAVKQNLEMLTGTRSDAVFAASDNRRLDRTAVIDRYRAGTGLDPSGGDAPTPFEQSLIDLQERINVLNNETLPELERALTDLNDVALPALQQELDDVLPITEVKIGDDSITAPKIAANAVVAGKIATDAIVANEIKSDTITGNMIKADTITAFNIDGDTITGNEINGNTLSAIFTNTGTLTANLLRTEIAPNGRVEIADTDDGAYAIWGGEGNSKTDEAGRFWVKHNGDAKFGGRIFANQLEGSILDAIPINVTGIASSSSNTTDWVTVGNRIVEIPNLIQRPRRPFMSLSVNVFGVGSDGAQVQGEIDVQNDDGTWPGTWQVVDAGVVNTIDQANIAAVNGGLLETGNRGFRIRVRFRAVAAGQTAQANEFTGIFMGLPAGNGYKILEDSDPTTVVEDEPEDTTVLIPPNFGVGWLDEP